MFSVTVSFSRAGEDRWRRPIRVAARRAVELVTRATERDVEALTEGARLGRLARVWASRVYPRAGLADRPAGLVFPRGAERTQGAIRSFTNGAQIRAGGGQYLTIPTGHNKPGGRRNARGGRVLVTPAEMIASGLAFTLDVGRGVKLWCLKVTHAQRRKRGGSGVVDLAYAGGLVAVGSGRRRRVGEILGRGFVPMFILVPDVSLRQRFTLEHLRRQVDGRLRRAFDLLYNGSPR